MTIKPITIENGQVTSRQTTNGIWLTQSQITDLFGVFISPVSANIRAIFKAEFCTKTALSAAHATEMETSLRGTVAK